MFCLYVLFLSNCFFRVLAFLIPDLGPIIRIIFVVMVSGGWCHLLFLWVSSLQYRAGVEKRKLAGVFARICLIRVILTFKAFIYFLCCTTKDSLQTDQSISNVLCQWVPYCFISKETRVYPAFLQMLPGCHLASLFLPGVILLLLFSHTYNASILFP